MTTADKPSPRATTAPKGRPTPARTVTRSQRTFGSTFQWTAAAVGLAVVLVVAWLLFFR